MTCYHPLTAWRCKSGRQENGKWPITFKQEEGFYDLPVSVPCGQCIGCRLERSRQWAIRCVHEASLHDDNCFVTLTYRDDDLGPGSSLNPRDITLFLKRLRKRFGDQKIRYFQCGEYGELLERPHHHALLFGFDFPDKRIWSYSNGVMLWRSAELERLWPFGYSSIGNVTFESSAYVARYILKKWKAQTQKEVDDYYGGRKPEYITMSRRPGIAREWFERFHGDVYPADQCIVRDGFIARPPKYYDSLYDVADPKIFAKLKQERIRKAKADPDYGDYFRLEVKEKIQKVKIQKLVRKMEVI